MMDFRDKSTRKKLFKKYACLNFFIRVQIFQRWLGAPYVEVEKFVPRQGLIYDLGCGRGIFSHFLILASRKRIVIGIDSDKKRIEEAKKTTLPTDPLSFYDSNLKKITLNKCRGIILFDVLHHISYNFHKAILEKSYQALEKDGVLVMMESHHKPYWKYLIWRIFEVVALGAKITKGDCLSLRPKNELKMMLEKIGFQVKFFPFHKGRFFPHILYIARKESLR